MKIANSMWRPMGQPLPPALGWAQNNPPAAMHGWDFGELIRRARLARGQPPQAVGQAPQSPIQNHMYRGPVRF